MTTPRTIAGLHYPREPADTHPPHLFPDYRSTVSRAPRLAPVDLAQRLTEVTGPVFGAERVGELDHDLTRQHDGEPLGQRIVVFGRVLEADDRPVPNTLIEIWQANAAGRYLHHGDNWPAPLDPHFTGLGRTLTDAGRAATASSPSGPAPTPGATTTTPGGPRTSTSRCSAARSPSDSSPRCTSLTTRCSRSIRSSTRCATRRPGRGWSRRSRLAHTEPSWALAFGFDIRLRGPSSTPLEDDA